MSNRDRVQLNEELNRMLKLSGLNENHQIDDPDLNTLHNALYMADRLLDIVIIVTDDKQMSRKLDRLGSKYSIDIESAHELISSAREIIGNLKFK